MNAIVGNRKEDTMGDDINLTATISLLHFIGPNVVMNHCKPLILKPG